MLFKGHIGDITINSGQKPGSKFLLEVHAQSFQVRVNWIMGRDAVEVQSLSAESELARWWQHFSLVFSGCGLCSNMNHGLFAVFTYGSVFAASISFSATSASVVVFHLSIYFRNFKRGRPPFLGNCISSFPNLTFVSSCLWAWFDRRLAFCVGGLDLLQRTWRGATSGDNFNGRLWRGALKRIIL